MDSMELVGLNIKWYRYQMNLTQEQFAEKSGFKMAYLSTIETGHANLTCRNIDIIAKTLKIKPIKLLDEETANLAKKLPPRVDMYKTKDKH